MCQKKTQGTKGTQNTVRNTQTRGAARAESWTSIAVTSDMKTNINVNAIPTIPRRHCEKADDADVLNAKCLTVNITLFNFVLLDEQLEDVTK